MADQALRTGARLLRPAFAAATRQLAASSTLVGSQLLPEQRLALQPTCHAALASSFVWRRPYSAKEEEGPPLEKASTSASADAVQRALNGAPPIHSLHFDRGHVPIPAELDNTFGKTMLQLLGYYSKKSQLLHGGQRLYDAVKEQVDSGVLQNAFQTGKVFWSSYVLLSLHVWMIIRRLQTSTHPDVKFFRQRFYIQFQQDVESRVFAAGVQVGVSKWLKKLEQHFYDSGVSFDRVLSGDNKETLETAMLKAFYGGEEQHRRSAQLLARYTIRELQCLQMTDEQAIFLGHVRFSRFLNGVVVAAEQPSAPVLAAVAASAASSAVPSPGAGPGSSK